MTVTAKLHGYKFCSFTRFDCLLRISQIKSVQCRYYGTSPILTAHPLLSVGVMFRHASTCLCSCSATMTSGSLQDVSMCTMSPLKKGRAGWQRRQQRHTHGSCMKSLVNLAWRQSWQYLWKNTKVGCKRSRWITLIQQMVGSLLNASLAIGMLCMR